jgi:hypothetical protein
MAPDDKGFDAVSPDQLGGGDHSSHAVDSSGGDGHGASGRRPGKKAATPL